MQTRPAADIGKKNPLKNSRSDFLKLEKFSTDFGYLNCFLVIFE